MVRRLIAAIVLGIGAGTAAAQDEAFDPAKFPIIERIDLSTWDRAFLGFHAGHASSDIIRGAAGADLSGWLAGIDAGVNIYLGQGVLVGVAADLGWSDLTPLALDPVLNWTGSVRGRVALDGGQFLPYLTAGVAFGLGEAEGSGAAATHRGWTAGIGVEVAVDDTLSIDTAWRYTELGSADYGSFSRGWNYQQLTIGVNWAIR